MDEVAICKIIEALPRSHNLSLIHLRRLSARTGQSATDYTLNDASFDENDRQTAFDDRMFGLLRPRAGWLRDILIHAALK